MKKFFTILLLTLICLTSCHNYKEIKNEEIRSAFILNSSATFEGYYYEGSDNKHHYFQSKWDFREDTYFKILIADLTIENKHKFKLGDKELRIDLFKDSNELFGQNEFCQLYVLKIPK